MERYSQSPPGDDRLSPLARTGMLLAGAILLLAAWPVGFVAAVISGGGHGSPFDSNWKEAMFGVAMLAIPVLMIVIGLACCAATTPRRAKVAGALALAIPVDLVVAVVAVRLASQTDPPMAYPVESRPPEFNMATAVIADGPTHVGIACSVSSDECVTTTTTYTATGKRTERKVEKATSPAKP